MHLYLSQDRGPHMLCANYTTGAAQLGALDGMRMTASRSLNEERSRYHSSGNTGRQDEREGTATGKGITVYGMASIKLHIQALTLKELTIPSVRQSVEVLCTHHDGKSTAKLNV